MFLEEYLFGIQQKKNYELPNRCKETLRLSKYRTVFYIIYELVKL